MHANAWIYARCFYENVSDILILILIQIETSVYRDSDYKNISAVLIAPIKTISSLCESSLWIHICSQVY